MSHIIDNITSEGLTDTKSFRAQAVVQATAASTLTLTVASEHVTIFTGTTAGQNLKLGDATTYQVGHIYIVHNNSTQSVTVQNATPTTLFTLAANQRAIIILQNNTTAAGIWSYALDATTISGSGTVTSVGLTMPSIFSVGGSPITTAGTLAVTLATETANTVFAGPTTGAAAIPTFRSLVLADLPQLTNGQLYIGSTGASVVAATLTAGTGISITNGAGSISVAATAQTGTGLQTKSGTVSAGSFAGNPKTATVTFGTAFANTSYSLTLTGLDDRSLSWQSKAAGSFVINTNSNVALTGNVDWQCIVIGEST